MRDLSQLLRDFKHYRQVTKPASKQRFKFYAILKRNILRYRKHNRRSLRIILRASIAFTYNNSDLKKTYAMMDATPMDEFYKSKESKKG
jgi:hypothetical protein